MQDLLNNQRQSLENLYRSGSIATVGLKKALEQITEDRFLFLCACFVFVLTLLGYGEAAKRLVFSIAHEHDHNGSFLEMPPNKVELEVNKDGLTQTTWVDGSDQAAQNGLVVAVRGNRSNTVAGRCYKICATVWDTRNDPPTQIHTGLGIHQR